MKVDFHMLQFIFQNIFVQMNAVLFNFKNIYYSFHKRIY